MNCDEIKNLSYKLLNDIYGENATFREGQYEAIEKALTNKRTLIVQKTGWGKSLVYFFCTKILRYSNKGVTFVISPLLTLMENQVESAEKMGLKCALLNSSTKDCRKEILLEIINDEVDIVFITPETLFSEDVQTNLSRINIGLFVIDEAHCISDWGHDFRLQYSNISKVLQNIPKNVPVLATTATANDRVVEDLEKQLGQNVYVSRGSLIRKNLSIQILNLKDVASRYAWILENINKISGCGIIYCLTQRDCDYLVEFLKKNKVNAMSYYSRSKEDESLNIEALELFSKNEIKVLVATIKLGMGYDKGDISFVIHFQQPSNIVSYYQQIGRAGRNIDRAYTFLMVGSEDYDIQNYFIETAFPTEKECNDVIDYISYKSLEGATKGDLVQHINSRDVRIEKALMFLENESFIYKEKSKYFSTVKEFSYNKSHYDEITKIRKNEQEQMINLTTTKECYSKFAVNFLDDKTDDKCGICKNCLGYEEFSSEIDDKILEKAGEYLNQIIIPIKPRKRFASTEYTKQTNIQTPNLEGIALSKYGQAGYGKLVKDGKYSGNKKFCDELVGKSVEVLKDVIKKHDIKAITFVPSKRSDIVEDFANRVAKRLKIKCINTIIKKEDTKQQKLMENTSYQCQNAIKSFAIKENVEIPENIILIDDIVDSKWTLTICGDILTNNGAICVFPFALADTSHMK